ncbi:ABC transporter permease [Pseudonocardia sp. CNS-139]|nr:ABC transporter permease [Pseudonocardia sp. CNS-139]
MARVERRTAVTVAVLAVLVAAGVCAEVVIGDYTSSVGESLTALVGLGDDPVATLFVQRLRLPRALVAVVVGAALGVSGAIFQAVSGNPLGSPDVIGFTTGAATGALVGIIVVGGTPGQIVAGALLGGAATAAAVYVLARRGGRVPGGRLVLVGVGIGAVLSAVNALLVVRASLDTAQTAANWLAGSLNATTWERLLLPGLAVAVLLPAALLHSRRLALLTMGDDVAAGMGVPPDRLRRRLVVLGVALVCVATAATGPIAFVALMAPQLARRLARSPGVGMTAAAAMGAALVLAADLTAQRLFAPTQLPVGVVTGAVGGIYLVLLLSRAWRRAR